MHPDREGDEMQIYLKSLRIPIRNFRSSETANNGREVYRRSVKTFQETDRIERNRLATCDGSLRIRQDPRVSGSRAFIN